MAATLSRDRKGVGGRKNLVVHRQPNFIGQAGPSLAG